MSENKESFLDNPIFIKIISYVVIFSILILWSLSFLTHDSSLLSYIKGAIYIYIFSEAAILARAYLHKLRIEEAERYEREKEQEAENRKREALQAITNAEFSEERNKGKKAGTTELLERQRSKESQGKKR